MARFFIFLMSYGLLVVSAAQLVFYFNYRTLGYEWSQVFYFIVRTTDFAVFVGAAILLTIIVSYRGPWRSPFSSG